MSTKKKLFILSLIVFACIGILQIDYVSSQSGPLPVRQSDGTNWNAAGVPIHARLTDGTTNYNALAEGTFTGRFTAGATPGDNESNAITTTRVGSYLFCFDGSTWDRCPGTAADGLLVNLGTNNDVTATNATASNFNAQVVGDVAHDSADAGNPVKIGGKGFSYGTAQTASAANDRINAAFDREGHQFTIPFHANTSTIEYMWTTAQTDDALVAVSAGTRIGVVGFQVTLDEATTVGVGIRCGFGASTLSTAPTDGNTATGIFLHHVGMVPGGGINSFPGLLSVGADGEDIRCTTEATTGGTGKIVISYFTTAN